MKRDRASEWESWGASDRMKKNGRLFGWRIRGGGNIVFRTVYVRVYQHQISAYHGQGNAIRSVDREGKWDTGLNRPWKRIIFPFWHRSVLAGLQFDHGSKKKGVSYYQKRPKRPNELNQTRDRAMAQHPLPPSSSPLRLPSFSPDTAP